MKGQIAIWLLKKPADSIAARRFDRALECRFVICERPAVWMVQDRDGNEWQLCWRHAMATVTGEMSEAEDKARTSAPSVMKKEVKMKSKRAKK